MMLRTCTTCNEFAMTLWNFCPFCGNRLEEEKKFELPQNKTTGELAKEAGAR